MPPKRVTEAQLRRSQPLRPQTDRSSDASVPTTVLTLHQPLASLMVWGLKRVEGRVWDSAFRGRLWIHAASKPIEESECTGGLAQCEEFYRQVFAEDTGQDPNDCNFPDHYPTSCLVGLVDVVDVVPADKYLSWRTLPKGAMQEGETNGCGYFFLCEQQRRLAIPFAMSGQHKLWHLGKGTAQNALRGLIDSEQMPISFMGHKEASVLQLAEDKRDKKQRRANAAAGSDQAAADCTSQWQCLTCTLVQSTMNAQCEVCGCEPPSAAVCVDLWTCEVCSFENSLLMMTCEMCGAATSQLQLPQSEDQQLVQYLAEDSGDEEAHYNDPYSGDEEAHYNDPYSAEEEQASTCWDCEACSFSNHYSMQQCEMCGSPQPEFDLIQPESAESEPHGHDELGSSEEFEMLLQMQLEALEPQHLAVASECPAISHGSQLEDSGSIFQAHLASVQSSAEVKQVSRALMEDPRIQAASCAPMAYRFSEGNTTKSDCLDMGEAGAGSRLAQLLETMKAQNVLVMVSRKVDGPMLGGRRWNHFLNGARELLQQCGHDARDSNPKSRKKSSKSGHKDKGNHIGGGGQNEVAEFAPTRKQKNYSAQHKDHG